MPLIIDKNKEITTPIKDIILKLKQQLDATGIDKLHDISFHSNNAVVTCPHHKDGRESTPSCYILLSDTDSSVAGTVHCFGCGWSCSFVKFIAECMNVSYRNALEWLLAFVDYTIVDDTSRENIKTLDYYLSKKSEEIDNNWGEISIDELKQYDYIHPYMFKRKLTDEIIEKFEIGYDPKTDCLTFPVYVDGKCIFVAKRKVKYKQFIMPEIVPKPIYGLDYITDNEIIVCESVLNALTCYVYGKQAIALFGTGSQWQIDMLKKLPVRKFILALDPDDAGKRGTAKIIKELTACSKIVSVLDIPETKDINDLSKEEFDNCKEKYVFKM